MLNAYFSNFCILPYLFYFVHRSFCCEALQSEMSKGVCAALNDVLLGPISLWTTAVRQARNIRLQVRTLNLVPLLGFDCQTLRPCENFPKDLRREVCAFFGLVLYLEAASCYAAFWHQSILVVKLLEADNPRGSSIVLFFQTGSYSAKVFAIAAWPQWSNHIAFTPLSETSKTRRTQCQKTLNLGVWISARLVWYSFWRVMFVDGTLDESCRAHRSTILPKPGSKAGVWMHRISYTDKYICRYIYIINTSSITYYMYIHIIKYLLFIYIYK
jgi:hypothetical protein